MKKRALDFSTTKKLLEKLKQDNIILIRSFGDIVNDELKSLSNQTNLPIESVKTALSYLENLRNSLVIPRFKKETKTIYLPRQSANGKFINL